VLLSASLALAEDFKTINGFSDIMSELTFRSVNEIQDALVEVRLYSISAILAFLPN
jgi:hypothetical protein